MNTVCRGKTIGPVTNRPYRPYRPHITMKWFSVAISLGVFAAFAAPAQAPAAAAPDAAPKADDGTLSGYSTLDIDGVGVYISDFKGRIESLSDGVRITLKSDDPEKKPLPISANKMTFSYAGEGGSTPSRIVLEGSVAIEHPQATVHAEKADWDFEKGTLTFTGNPVINSPQIKEAQAEKVVLNFNEDRVEMYKARAKELPLRGATEGAEQDPSFLSEQDIADWPAFIAKIKEQAADEKLSPGKRILGLMDEKVRNFLTTVPSETLLQDKSAVLKQINKVMANKSLYDASVWKGITFAPEIAALLDKKPLEGKEQTQLNRALIEAAYPDIIK